MFNETNIISGRINYLYSISNSPYTKFAVLVTQSPDFLINQKHYVKLVSKPSIVTIG